MVTSKASTPAKVKLLPPAKIDRLALIVPLTAAHAAIGELRGFLGGLKNPDLLIAPFRKREAVASSAIEGTRATLEEVMEYEALDKAPINAADDEMNRKIQDIIEVVNYEKAMAVALKELQERPIGENLIRKTHDTLLDHVRGANKDRGNFRKWPVAVGEYIPPVSTDIPSLIHNWEKYLNTPEFERDPLIRIGVAHYQFEAIHPFMDGNGRIGRLIIPLFLCQEGMLQTPVLYISHYLEQYKVEYQRLLHEVDIQQRWTEWIVFFLRAVEEQAKITTSMAKEIQALYERLKVEVIENIRSQHAIAVLDLIFSKPVITTADVKAKISAKSEVTSYHILKKFVKAGVVREIGGMKRGKIYVFTELRKILSR